MDIKKILFGKIGKASALLAFFSFLADIVALVRDRILAGHFGASRTLDIYYSAFKIPDLIFNLFILGAVSSAFIPVFIERYRSDQGDAWRLAQKFLTVAVIGVILTAGAIFIFMEPFARLVAPGFSASDRVLLIQLMRIMLISPILFSVSTVFGSMLQSLERFLAYAIAPVLYNLGIIVGAVWFVPLVHSHGQPEVLGLGLGVVLGALLHLMVQVPSVIRAGFRPRLVIDFADMGLRKIIRLMIPRTIGIGAYSIESVTMNAMASLLATGSIAMFTLANNLQFVPISVVGVSVATAVFPSLSAAAADNNFPEFKNKLYTALRNTAFVSFALAVALALGGQFILSVLFKTGAFSGQSVHTTAMVLAIFMLGVVAQSLIPIMSRAFYALQDTRTPVVIAVFSIFVDILLGLVFAFAFKWGIYGLALAIALAGNINYLLLHLAFLHKYRDA